MKRKGMVWIWAALAALGLALAGCGDSNLFDGSGDEDNAQANKEAGIEALNGGDWAEAQRIFLELDPDHSDPELSGYLASAYAGEAGFDALGLVQDIFDAQDQGVDESVIYGSVTAMFDADGDGRISSPELEGKMALLWKALEALQGAQQAGRVTAAASTSDPWGQARFQRGLYAAAHAVLGIAAQLRVDPSDPESDVYLTLQALADHREAIEGLVVSTDGFDLNDDLALVAAATEWLRSSYPDGNKIADEIEKFLDDIGYATDGVDDTELRAYLNRLLDALSPV